MTIIRWSAKSSPTSACADWVMLTGYGTRGDYLFSTRAMKISLNLKGKILLLIGEREKWKEDQLLGGWPYHEPYIWILFLQRNIGWGSTSTYQFPFTYMTTVPRLTGCCLAWCGICWGQDGLYGPRLLRRLWPCPPFRFGKLADLGWSGGWVLAFSSIFWGEAPSLLSSRTARDSAMCSAKTSSDWCWSMLKTGELLI